MIDMLRVPQKALICEYNVIIINIAKRGYCNPDVCLHVIGEREAGGGGGAPHRHGHKRMKD